MSAAENIDGKRASVFALTEKGSRVAAMVAGALPGARVFGPDALRDGGLARAVTEEFHSSSALVFISAVGIAVRMIAPYLRGKAVDPAVVVIDDNGTFAISLLSGHLGGANDLARTLASAIGATPVITTATDAAGLPCAEDIAGAFDLAIENTGAIKAVNSAIISGRGVLVVDDNPARLRAMREKFEASGVFSFADAMPDGGADGRALVVVSSLSEPGLPQWARARALMLRPREFVIGVGCRRGVSEAEVAEACAEALRRSGISALSVRNMATVDIKSDEAGLIDYASGAGLPMEFFTAPELDRIVPPSGESKTVRENVGCGGVSEPAAMISAGADELWMKKLVSGRVTVAVARVG